MSCWEKTIGSVLNQGDLLWSVGIPLIDASVGTAQEGDEISVEVADANVVIVTQSCDLEQQKTQSVLVARFYSVPEFEAVNPNFKAGGRWKEVSRGRVEGLYLLSSPERPNDPRSCLVVDFRDLASLPLIYVIGRATDAGERWRMKPPYLEHFSQAFGRYYMRVALPADMTGY